jgi:hypothetical protein
MSGVIDVPANISDEDYVKLLKKNKVKDEYIDSFLQSRRRLLGMKKIMEGKSITLQEEIAFREKERKIKGMVN